MWCRRLFLGAQFCFFAGPPGKMAFLSYYFFWFCVSFKHNFQFVLVKYQTKMAEIQINVDPMEEEAF